MQLHSITSMMYSESVKVSFSPKTFSSSKIYRLTSAAAAAVAANSARPVGLAAVSTVHGRVIGKNSDKTHLLSLVGLVATSKAISRFYTFLHCPLLP